MEVYSTMGKSLHSYRYAIMWRSVLGDTVLSVNHEVVIVVMVID